LAVTIADDTTARVCNSYAADLIALLGAHQMLHHLGVEQKEQCITTDCEAAQKTINGKRYKKWATAEQAQIIHGISRLNRQNIAWTPSDGMSTAGEAAGGFDNRWRSKIASRESLAIWATKGNEVTIHNAHATGNRTRVPMGTNL
jgi:hypothetical protein